MSITIFVADDHAVVRDGLKYLLEAQDDLRVIGDAADGRSAVSLVEELRPDVAIVDVAMPGLNGIEATRQIRQSCPEVKTIIEKLRPKAAILTHFGMTMWRAKPWELAERLTQETGIAVIAARDGMKFDLTQLQM